MARARTRPGSKKRRMNRRIRELLRAHSAQQDIQDSGAGEDTAEQAASALPLDKDAVAPEAASADDQKTPSPEPKHQCKHRRLPDRHYYARPDEAERRYLALERRLTSRMDEKIAQGAAAVEQWKRHADAYMAKCIEKFERHMDEVNSRFRTNHVRLKLTEARVESISERYKKLQKRSLEELDKNQDK